MRCLWLILLFITEVSVACDKEKKEIADLIKANKLPGVSCESLTVVAKLIKNPPKSTPGRHLFKQKNASGNPQIYADLCNDPDMKAALSSAESIQDPQTKKLALAAVLHEAEEFEARNAVLNNREISVCK